MQTLDSITKLADEIDADAKVLAAKRKKLLRAMKRAKEARWTFKQIGEAAHMTASAAQKAIQSLDADVLKERAEARRRQRTDAK
jgi:Fic family protein